MLRRSWRGGELFNPTERGWRYVRQPQAERSRYGIELQPVHGWSPVANLGGWQQWHLYRHRQLHTFGFSNHTQLHHLRPHPGRSDSSGCQHVQRQYRGYIGLLKESPSSVCFEFMRFAARDRKQRGERKETRCFHVLGFDPLLWAAQQQRSFHRLADYGEEANGREAESHQGRASTPSAYPPNTMIHGQRVRCSCP